MKTLYIPRGKTMRLENLDVDHLVVRGSLIVAHAIRAKTITGGGFIQTHTIEAGFIHANIAEARAITCRRLVASRVDSVAIIAEKSATVSCSLNAHCLKAPRLTAFVADLEIQNVEEVYLLASAHNPFSAMAITGLRSLQVAMCGILARNTATDAHVAPIEEQTAAHVAPGSVTRLGDVADKAA